MDDAELISWSGKALPLPVQALLARVQPNAPREIDVAQGWWPLLVRLDAQLTQIDPDYTIRRVARRAGRLLFDLHDSEHRLRLEALARYAEDQSTRVCEVCGTPGRLSLGPDYDGLVLCIDHEGFPASDLSAADLEPGDIVLRNLARSRAGVVVATDPENERVWIRQVSGKEHHYVLELRLCRPVWLEKLSDSDAWLQPPNLGDQIEFIDYDGWQRSGVVVEIDEIFIRIAYQLRSGEYRHGWYDRFARQQPRRRPG